MFIMRQCIDVESVRGVITVSYSEQRQTLITVNKCTGVHELCANSIIKVSSSIRL